MMYKLASIFFYERYSTKYIESVSERIIYNFQRYSTIKNPKMPDDNLPAMIAWYTLDTNTITVNLDQMKYVLLGKNSEDHCSSPLCHYCEVQSPVYSITSSKFYNVALFSKDGKRIKKSCQTIVAPTSILSQASHVIDGPWFVAT